MEASKKETERRGLLTTWRDRRAFRKKLRLLRSAGINGRQAASIASTPIRSSRKRTVRFAGSGAEDLRGGARYERRVAQKRKRRGESTEVHERVAAFLKRLADEVGEGTVADLKPRPFVAAFKEAAQVRQLRAENARSTFERRRRAAFKGIVGRA